MEFQECLQLLLEEVWQAWRDEGQGQEGMEQQCWVGSQGSGLSRGLCLLTVPAVPCPADLSQMEITRAYLAKEADELSLQQADVVLVLGGEDGECQRARGWG